mmetsp:Transcript_34987/g.48886  ORF Transcript_34987/g.48886 Transcript_34987/m.48886 type:complete len:342 (-) Transcript_34987:149-1174(-)|eukprot:jgi/Bigna1/86651/estExt_fgenesh1_pg.C_120146
MADPSTELSADELKAAVIDRIHQRNQNRSEKERKRKTAIESERKRAGENVEDFSRTVAQQKETIIALLETAKEIPAEKLRGRFEAIMAKIFELQHFAAASTFFLPPYEIQQARKIVSELQNTASKEKSRLLPRRRFRFSKKRKPKEKKEGGSAPSGAGTVSTEGEKLFSLVKGDTMFTIENKSDQIVKVNEEDFKENRNIKLSEMANSEIHILHGLSTLRMTDLKTCKIYVGPVSGPVYIERCEGCTFFFACRQLRAHEMKECNVYLRVASKPIIEHCSGIGFAPYIVEYENLARDLVTAGFTEKQPNCWDQVCDFNWLREQQSPNWFIIADDKREKARKL